MYKKIEIPDTIQRQYIILDHIFVILRCLFVICCLYYVREYERIDSLDFRTW